MTTATTVFTKYWFRFHQNTAHVMLLLVLILIVISLTSELKIIKYKKMYNITWHFYTINKKNESNYTFKNVVYWTQGKIEMKNKNVRTTVH